MSINGIKHTSMLNDIVLFGGTFNPIHNGHLAVCSYLFEKGYASNILLMPNMKNPLGKLPLFSAKDRLAMIQLAIQANTKISVSDYELNKTGPSYTIDTVEFIKKTQAPVALIIGDDILNDFHRWHRPIELLHLLNQLYIMRRISDSEIMLPDIFTAVSNKITLIPNPLWQISSTKIRSALHKHKNISDWVPNLVADYLRKIG